MQILENKSAVVNLHVCNIWRLCWVPMSATVLFVSVLWAQQTETNKSGYKIQNEQQAFDFKTDLGAQM